MKKEKPQLWRLNGSWGEHNLSTTFIDQGFWEIDPTRLNDIVSLNRLTKIKRGDIVHLIHYSRSVCATTVAVGSVTGVNFRRMKVLVSWRKEIHPREYHKGAVRPIAGPFSVGVETRSKPKAEEFRFQHQIV